MAGAKPAARRAIETESAREAGMRMKLRPFADGFRLLAALTALIAAPCAATAQTNMPAIKVSVLKFGTVNWELNTIAHHQLDTKHGFKLEVAEVAGEAAAKIAFQGSAADAMVSVSYTHLTLPT